MPSTTTKTVKVSSDTAEDWEGYVEENAHVDSLSHLIRLSVQREINGAYEEQRASGEQTNGQTSFDGEAKTLLRQMNTTLGEVEERLSSLEETKEADAGYSLKKAVWELLPPEPEQAIDGEIPPVYGDGKPFDSVDVVTPRELATRLGADVGDVQEVLDELVETTAQVHRNDENHDGNHYWKEGR